MAKEKLKSISQLAQEAITAKAPSESDIKKKEKEYKKKFPKSNPKYGSYVMKFSDQTDYFR